MKPIVLAIICLAVVIVACKREDTNAVWQGSPVVVFPDAGVSIDVGGGWKHIDISPGLPVCPPTLVGPSGMIRAMLFGPAVSNTQAATNAIWMMYSNNPDAAKNSFHVESFTTDSGLPGQHISYNGQSDKNGTVTEIQSHNFIVQRQDGRCVSISYITTAQTNSSDVCQMIQKSLKLQ